MDTPGLAATVVLDGGLATQLEAQGHDLSDDLWSARLLQTHPKAIVEAHSAYFAAGAQVAITASYQVSQEGYVAAGYSAQEARVALSGSVALARAAAFDTPGEGRRWIAGSVGPYGAYLADGQEYTGEYTDPDWAGRTEGGLSIEELAQFHRRKIDVLAQAGIDLLACETVPCLAEVEALCLEITRVEVPAWLSLTVTTNEAGEIVTRRGEPIADAFAMAAQTPHVVAIGVNCCDPMVTEAAAHRARTVMAALGRTKPMAVVAYPNSGELWDGATRGWTGQRDWRDELIHDWVAAGANWIGGCCRVEPSTIAQIAQLMRPADR